MPGVKFGVRDAVDEQVGFTGLRAAVFGGQPAPGQFAPVFVGVFLLTGFKRGSAWREGAAYDRFAAVAEHLNIDAVTPFDAL
ncbi:hypothetical protein ALP75_202410 [Pseudomonas syringae pv. actinidiae]|nr:hypothetical protein ALP75_202410 [Pseudomonas syringae pv. actinidiae]